MYLFLVKKDTKYTFTISYFRQQEGFGYKFDQIMNITIPEAEMTMKPNSVTHKSVSKEGYTLDAYIM